MTTILTILAIFLGPIIAVRLTRYLDNKKEERERRLIVFKTLMATRASGLSPQHVEALNRIDLEFDSNKPGDLAVKEAWKAYLDLLAAQDVPGDIWHAKRVDLLVELLHKMAKALNYQFDKTHIKNSSYQPRFYGELEQYQNSMRQAMMELIEGKRTLSVHIDNTSPPRQDIQGEAKAGDEKDTRIKES